MTSYASYTRDTSEPLKRIAHARRHRQVLDLVAAPLPADRILDYGCGDGHLLSYFVDSFERRNLVGYDPDTKLLREAEPSVVAGAQLTATIDDLQPSSFTLIYCMEVCEHLTDKALATLIQNITVLAAPNARIVIGVPIETGLSGFLKSLYRAAHGGRQSAGIVQAFRALFGMKIEREVTDVEWHGPHTGFSHTRLRKMLEDKGFLVLKTVRLPFPALKGVLNNEVYWVTTRPLLP